jgi:hypothetical protein
MPPQILADNLVGDLLGQERNGERRHQQLKKSSGELG